MNSNTSYFKEDIGDLKEYEYDAQLFGFTLQDFMTAIKQLVKEEVTSFTEAMTKALLNKITSLNKEVDETEIEMINDITKSLINKYICASVEPLKTLETQLKDIIHIPPHVLLPEDSCQRTQYTAKEEQDIDEQLKMLLARIKRTKAFDVELRQELKTLRDILPRLNKQVKDCECLVAVQKEFDISFHVLEPVIDNTSVDIVNNRLQFLNLQTNCSKNSDTKK